MSDLCRVLMIGHLSRDLERHIRDDGVVYAVSTLCAARTLLLAGRPVVETTRIAMEVVGAARVASVAQQFGMSSRVLVEGHLELRESVRIERLPLADGAGEVLVRVPRSELALVVETIFNAEPPLPAAEAQHQPSQVWWQEAS
jgi:hypothetical protein